MIGSAIIIKELSSIGLLDIGIIFIGIIIGNTVFNNFEKHLSLLRRIVKGLIMLLILTVIGILMGRVVFYGLIGIMTIGQIILHAWYFPKHGINGLTAEPNDKYLDLIKKMKGSGKDKESP